MHIQDIRHLKIKTEIFLLCFCVLILILLLFAAVFLNLLYNNNMDNAKNSLYESNSLIVSYVEALFHETASIISLLALDNRIIYADQKNSDEVKSLFLAIAEKNTNVSFIYSGYIDGSLIINNYATPVDYDATTRPWYLGAVASDGISMMVYPDAVTGEWLFNQSIKLADRGGNTVGVMAIDCSNELLASVLRSKYRYRTQRSFVSDVYGVSLIHPNESELNKSVRYQMNREVWDSIINGTNSYAEYIENGALTMAYFERVPQTDFIVATAINANEIIFPIMSGIGYLFCFSAVVSLLLGLAFSRLIAYRIARPIVELGGRIQDLARDRPVKKPEIRFPNEEIRGIADDIEIIVQKMAQREKERKAAEYLSFHDALTGLFNRRFFNEELRRLDVARNYPLCVISCDVNGLKLVNDVFGHAVGDKLIATVAGCLEKSCRSDDILARVGGDEFALLLPRTSEEESKQIIRRIESRFPDEHLCGICVSASVGYAIKNGELSSMEDTLQAADEMMYNHKLLQSPEMKRRTAENFLAEAKKEFLIKPLTVAENKILTFFAAELCTDSYALLCESYRLREIGLCKFPSMSGYSMENRKDRHTETAYRILSPLEAYRDIGSVILHYKEHWDGSGSPAGLSGSDIPLFSRILAITEFFVCHNRFEELLEKKGIWFDPELVDLLVEEYHDAAYRV